MKTHRETAGNPPFKSASATPFEPSTHPAGSGRAGAHSIRRRRRSLPAGWRKLSTGVRGAWLYVVTLHNGGAYWLVEVMHNGAELSRRFASEMHARAWLIELLRPYFKPASFTWEKMNEPLHVALRDSAGIDHSRSLEL